MTPHIIRLRDFWSREVRPDGRVRLVRNFGRPRTLAANETAWLVGRAPGNGTASLNGTPLGPLHAGEPFAFDLTARLAPRNAIAFDLDGADTIEAALEIRESVS